MNLLLLNPPHTAIGSRVPGELLPPLGLLALGGPLCDAGFGVSLLNADLAPLSLDQIAAEVRRRAPDVVLMGHSGSTSAHPTCMALAALLKDAPHAPLIVYGGVYPSYHHADILIETDAIDWIARGEGEETVVALMTALKAGDDPRTIPGLAFRDGSVPRATRPAPMIADLDAHRIGWELIDHADYSYWGGKRAVILQFSRGCPHLCTYCGQRGFWTKWRTRNPERFAAEIGRLVREEGIELVNLADENPTSSRKLWTRFLKAMVAEQVDVLIVGSTRADDIVRDADLMPLYREAGVVRFLLGLEGTDEATLTALRKGGTRAKDQQAIQLLRDHGMIGLCTFAVGFAEERDRDYWRLLQTLLAYDPDQIMSVYATPHRWTPFYADSADRDVVQPDMRRWDYKHQVLATPHIPPWRVFLWVKAIEMILQLRPKALYRCWLQPDARLRHAMRWYSRMGGGVILSELADLFWRARPRAAGTVAQMMGGGARLPEDALSRVRAPRDDIATDIAARRLR